jgi:hypothetical protein
MSGVPVFAAGDFCDEGDAEAYEETFGGGED